jgi:predicted RNA-binding Zn ribbon-like protein
MVEGMTDGTAIIDAALLGEPLPVELMNTVALDRGRTRDALADDTGPTVWLRAVADRLGPVSGLQADQIDDHTVLPVAGELRALRDALRQLAAEMTDDPRPPATAPGSARHEAVATLNALAQAWPELVWPADGPPSRMYRGSGTAARLAVQLIAHQAVVLLTGPDRERLRPCLAPNCLLYFFKNHPRREWCSPACGNRARAARHYARHR